MLWWTFERNRKYGLATLAPLATLATLAPLATLATLAP